MIAYASAGSAISLANGETADIYARPVSGGVETAVPLKKFAQDNIIEGSVNSENRELTIPPSNANDAAP